MRSVFSEHLGAKTMRVLLFVLIALIFGAGPGHCGRSNLHAEETSSVYIVGAGLDSCATWQSSRLNFNDGSAWIFGFWSGLNTLNAKNHVVGSLTDGEGIVAEVKKICGARPSMNLTDAVIEVYSRMARAK